VYIRQPLGFNDGTSKVCHLVSLLHKANVAPRHSCACLKLARLFMSPSFQVWGPVNAPSPHCSRYCLLAIDHHTNYMLVRFLKLKAYSCSELESV
jgi:hypothetical protein